MIGDVGLLAEGAADFHSVQAREHQIEDDEVGVGFAGQIQAGDAVGGGSDIVPVLLQVQANHSGDARVIFYDKYVVRHSDLFNGRSQFRASVAHGHCMNDHGELDAPGFD